MPELKIRPKWRLDKKYRVTLKEDIRKLLGIGPGAWGYLELYDDKILLIVIDKGVITENE